MSIQERVKNLLQGSSILFLLDVIDHGIHNVALKPLDCQDNEYTDFIREADKQARELVRLTYSYY